MEVSDVARHKQLEAENAQMHRIIARLTLKAEAMEDLVRNRPRPPAVAAGAT